MADKDDDRMPQPLGYPNAASADRRKAYERHGVGVHDEAVAERAFLANKIELIRSDPQLSADEKDAAVAALQSRLDTLTSGAI